MKPYPDLLSESLVGNYSTINPLAPEIYGSNFQRVVNKDMSRIKVMSAFRKLLPGEYRRTHLMTNHHWFR